MRNKKIILNRSGDAGTSYAKHAITSIYYKDKNGVKTYLSPEQVGNSEYPKNQCFVDVTIKNNNPYKLFSIYLSLFDPTYDALKISMPYTEAERIVNSEKKVDIKDSTAETQYVGNYSPNPTHSANTIFKQQGILDPSRYNPLKSALEKAMLPKAGFFQSLITRHKKNPSKSSKGSIFASLKAWWNKDKTSKKTENIDVTNSVYPYGDKLVNTPLNTETNSNKPGSNKTLYEKGKLSQLHQSSKDIENKDKIDKQGSTKQTTLKLTIKNLQKHDSKYNENKSVENNNDNSGRSLTNITQFWNKSSSTNSSISSNNADNNSNISSIPSTTIDGEHISGVHTR